MSKQVPRPAIMKIQVKEVSYDEDNIRGIVDKQRMDDVIEVDENINYSSAPIQSPSKNALVDLAP